MVSLGIVVVVTIALWALLGGNVEAWVTRHAHCPSSFVSSASWHDCVPLSSPSQIRRRTSCAAAAAAAATVDDDEPLSWLELPIHKVLPEIRAALLSEDGPQNLLLEAPPGAGKTSVVPLALLSEPWAGRRTSATAGGGIWVVEPRRVAARSAAARMASSQKEGSNQVIGQTVGLVIRGEVRRSMQHTRVTIMTDGVLLRMLRDDPELTGVAAIVFDEFHERGVSSDTALALCREIQLSLRPDLRLIVMSATLLGSNPSHLEDHHNDIHTGKDNANQQDESTGARLLRALGGAAVDGGSCHVVRSQGRQFPVTLSYSGNRRGAPTLSALRINQNNRLLVDTTVRAVEEVLGQSEGDVLVFLPGAREIRSVVRELVDRGIVDAEVLPLYGALSKKEQEYAIRSTPSSRKRVIVASPIAEASLTLERVTTVVDSGLRREPQSDVDTGMPRLVTVPCSKASAVQRAGRAGRTRPGMCLRLCSESEFHALPEHSDPEILSADLTPTAILLLDWGCSRPHEILTELPFVDAPKKDALERAFQMLVSLGAVEKVHANDGTAGRYMVTLHGRRIASLPMHPRLATCIANAKSSAELASAVAVAALLDDEVMTRDGKGVPDDPDLSIRVCNLLRESSKGSSSSRLNRYAARIGTDAQEAVRGAIMDLTDIPASLGTALLPGFGDLVAQRRGADKRGGGSVYRMALGRTAQLDGTPEKNPAECIVVTETSAGDDGMTRIRSYATMDEKVLRQIATERDVVFTEPSRGHEVRARRVLAVGVLELSSTPLSIPPQEKVSAVLREAIRTEGGVSEALWKPLSKDRRCAVDDLRERVRLACQLSSNHKDDSEKDTLWPPCFAALDAQVEKRATKQEHDMLEDMVEPWLGASSSLAHVDLLQVLLGALTNEQRRQLDANVPNRIDAPDGSTIAVSYSSGTPVASAKLQQFFGTTSSPLIGPMNHRIPVSLSLLSPAGKPLAQTNDLHFFWTQVYPSVRAEMRGRYSKHPWPENPFTAIPTRSTKKQDAKHG